MEIFNTIANAINPETAKMRAELSDVLAKISKLEAQQNGGYTAQVAKSFHLGMVGGSGKNNYKLNARRESELEKTIERAKVLCELYKQRNALETRIEYIESGKRDEDEKKKKRGGYRINGRVLEGVEGWG